MRRRSRRSSRRSSRQCPHRDTEALLARVPEPEQPELADEREPVRAALRRERDARPEQRDVQHAASVSEHAVGDELEQEERVARLRQRPVEERAPAAGHHPHLPAVLVLDVRRRLLPGDGLGLVHRAAAALHEAEGEAEVVADVGVVPAEVVRAAHAVDRAVAGRDRPDRGLALALPELVAPVHALLVRAVDRLQPELPAHVADLRVAEAADELPQRVGLPARVRVGERDHLGIGLGHGAVLRGRLPGALHAQELHVRRARGELLDDLVGAVGRAVGRDDDLESLRRVVELEEVLDAARDHVLLVVGRDDHGHVGSRVVLADRARAEAGERSRGNRVAGVRPRERAEAAPEHGFQKHGATIASARAAVCREVAGVVDLRAARELPVRVLVVDGLAEVARAAALRGRSGA